MAFLFAPVLAAAVIASAQVDRIDRLVADLSNDHAWTDGIFVSPDLPGNAPIKDVVAVVLEQSRFPVEVSQPWKYKILETRKVHIPPFADPYTAVLLDTNYGKQIVLLQFSHRSWWSKLIGAN